MLDFQLVQAPFRLGVDEGTDPKQVPFGTLTLAENVEWVKSGRLQKREGTELVATLANAKRLILRGNELCATDGQKLYSMTDSGFAERGRTPEVGLEWEVSVDTVTGVSSSDTTVFVDGSTRYLEAWVSGDPALLASGTLYYQIRDPDAEAVLTPATMVSANVRPRIRVLSNGSQWVILWISNAGELKCTTAFATTTLKIDARVNANASLDACVIGDEFVVAYALDGGSIGLVRYTFDTVPVEQTHDVVSGEISMSIPSISIDGRDGETLYIAYFNGAIQFAAADPTTLAQTVAPISVETSGTVSMGSATVALARSSSSDCLLVYSFMSNEFDAGVTRSVTIDDAGSVTTGVSSFFTRVLSRPFSMNDRFYCLFGTDSLASAFTGSGGFTSNDTFLVDVTNDVESFREVGKIDPLIGGCWIRGYVSNPVALSETKTIVPIGFQSTPAAGQVGVRQGVRLIECTTGADLPKDMWRNLSVGGEAYIAAGVLTSYDGVDPLGYGWPNAPYIDPANTSASAIGGGMATGNYIYNVTGERRSRAGVLHRSPVGVALTKGVTGPTGKVTVGIVSTSLGMSSSNPGQFPIYRSLVDQTIPQRIAVEPSYMTISQSGITTYPTTILDDDPDNAVGPSGLLNLAARPPIYTAGGELEDTQPPAFLSICLYRSRLFGIAGDRSTGWFSKRFDDNPGVAPGFHPDFRILFNDDMSGLGVLDERLFLFARRAIYYLAGDGPAPNGDNSDFSVPNRLQSDVGCMNPRGIVSGPAGLFFVSGDDTRAEIHMLDRKLNVQWVGKPVQDLLDDYPNVTSAVLVPSKNHVRFSCVDENGGSGIVLVYDYVEGQWSHFTYYDSSPIVDACLWNGVYTFITSDGSLYREVPGSYLDNGEWVTARLVTAWAHANGPLSYQSVRNFRIDGEAHSNFALSIYAGFNGEESFTQGPRTWDGDIAGVTRDGDISCANLSIGTRRKCRSIRFKIEDAEAEDGNSGQGALWSSMGVEVGVMGGFGRLPATQRR